MVGLPLSGALGLVGAVTSGLASSTGLTPAHAIRRPGRIQGVCGHCSTPAPFLPSRRPIGVLSRCQQVLQLAAAQGALHRQHNCLALACVLASPQRHPP